MQITDAQVKLVKEMLAQTPVEGETQGVRPEDAELIREVTHAVINAPDREDRIAELKARYEAGQYNPTGAEIADAMIRRAIADRIR